MSLLAVVDKIVAEVTAPAGITRDDTGADPSPYAADTLYGWPVVDRFVPTGTGGMDEGRFLMRLAITVAAAEGPGLVRERSASEALDAAVDGVRSWVAAHRSSSGLWESLQVDAANHDDIRGEGYRGVRLDLSGYRLMED